MTKDEALKMAIEAMEITDEAFTEFSKGLVGLGIPASILKLDKQSRLIPAIQACKEALEQPAQEPLAWMDKLGFLWSNEQRKHFSEETDVPLYTHPAPSWQGLSDDEDNAIIKKIWIWGNDFPYEEYRIAIEQALKEKNNAL